MVTGQKKTNSRKPRITSIKDHNFIPESMKYLFSILFTLATCVLITHRSTGHHGPLPRQVLNTKRDSVQALKMPTTLKEAFLLGRYHGTDEMEQLLTQYLTLSERIIGLFSVVNMLRMVAVMGFVLSIVPVVIQLLNPILLSEFFSKLVVLIAPYSLYFCYVGAFVVIYLGHTRLTDYPLIFTLLIGLGLFFMCIMSEKEDQLQVDSFFLGLTAALLAWSHQSMILAWISTVCLMLAIEFSVLYGRLFIMFGYASDDIMIRNQVLSGIILLGNTYLKYHGHITVFTSPLTILGGINFYLTTLTYSIDGKAIHQLITILAIFLGIVLGTLLRLDGLVRTSITFGALYLQEKNIQTQWSLSIFWFIMLINSIMIYYVSLFLYRHEGWISSILE